MVLETKVSSSTIKVAYDVDTVYLPKLLRHMVWSSPQPVYWKRT